LKVFFQQLCLAKVRDWDDELKGELLEKWKRLVHNLNSLKDIKVPRCYFTRKEEPPVKHELHGFSDSSNKAFAAVVYLRTEHAKGDIEINLVASKTRVAPIKRQSIPRLELLGATILVRLVKSVKEATSSLKTHPEVFLWSDSYAVLCLIRNDKTWKPLVQEQNEGNQGTYRPREMEILSGRDQYSRSTLACVAGFSAGGRREGVVK
jgi:hypothetical protein